MMHRSEKGKMGAYLRTCKYAKEMNPKSRIYLGNELFYSEDGDALTGRRCTDSE